MASTNKTTNYELSQFIEADRPAWLTDYNEDMRTVDSIMKAISDVASGASGSISELADRMSTAEGNITTNTNDIATLDARADSLEAQAQSTAGTIANIQTEQTAQNLGIEAATELGYNLARPYDSASTYAVGDYVLFQNTLYKCITAVATGEVFDPAKWLAIKATDEIAAGGYTLPIASASQLGGVKVGDGLNIDPVTGVLSIPQGESVINVENSEQVFSINTSVIPQLGFVTNTLYTTTRDSHYRSLTISDDNLAIANSYVKILRCGNFIIFRPGVKFSFNEVASPRDIILNYVRAQLILNTNHPSYSLLHSIKNAISLDSYVLFKLDTLNNTWFNDHFQIYTNSVAYSSATANNNTSTITVEVSFAGIIEE